MNNYILANCSDVGKTRSVNEDSMTTFESPNGRVVVVCDGMGGQNAGDVASKLAIDVIQDILTDNTFPTPEEAISKSIMAANQAILRRAAQNPSLSGMGSTCVMAIIKDDQLYYGSVGDSRMYYIANRMIRQITKDQSYVQTLVDAGEITVEQAEHHANKNEITNALGVDSMTPPVVGKMPVTPEPGSVVLLCSDGLSGMINNNTIQSTVSRNDLTLQERAELLVQQANDAGGNDNITVQLIEFRSASAASPISSKRNTQIKSTKSGGKGFGILALLLVLVLGGGAAWWFMNNTPDEPKQQPVQKKEVVKKPEARPSQDTKEPIVIKEKVVVKKKASNDPVKKIVSKKNQQKSGNGNIKDVTKPNPNPESEDAVIRKEVIKKDD